MRNIQLVLEYDGSRYAGWIRTGKDESTNTVSNKILEVIEKMTEEAKIELFCGCRTEVGVHAYNQVVNFKTHTPLSVKDIKQYMNRYLPMDIVVLEVYEKPERFHSTLNALSRTYLYRIAIGDAPSVFERKYQFYSFKKPNIELMKEAANSLIGEHDFAKFTSAKRTKSTIKEISSIDIYEDTKEIQITITANDFLHNMARMVIGTLIDIGIEKRPVSDINLILNTKSPIEASALASPQGLILDHINY